MIYLSVILVCFFDNFNMQKLLPAKWQNKINLMFFALLMALPYNLLIMVYFVWAELFKDI